MINAIVAIGQVDWEAQFVSGLNHPSTGISVQRRCVDAVDALAVTQVLSCDVVIVSDHTMRIDQEFVAELIKQKIRVIALTSQPAFFENLGKVECVVINPNNPLAAIPLLASLVRVNRKQPELPTQPNGELIFVGGFGGGTGKTRLALELAHALSAKPKKTLLVDADTYGPTMLQLLGLSASKSGLLEVCRNVERKAASQNLIEHSAIEVSENLFFIPGLMKPSRWVDLRAVTLKEFWQLAITQFDYVIVDAGPVLEPEPLVALETGLPKRNLVSFTALVAAQKVILTCREDATSITRLIKGVTENLTSLKSKGLNAIVLGTGSKQKSREVIEAIQLHTEIYNVQVVALDREVIESAESNNASVVQSSPKSDLAVAYPQILESVIESATNPVTNSRLQKLITKKRSAKVA